ncbi:ABC transporter, permease protein [Marvinbryantia formatexigens DSM 14469]|uniref:ABC transporter, permease protein n=1 Tax=Marvinbryantia formatexigens DSM 14469 TaxID=478749 RepID=C6L8R5_9FIRM|nr:carbohydrate ABC transporter permease [Marvinbryantia formatexigens]EET62654.1 ABC transporter, permease protein [Marvinbryantia formatexigens DSM 14469]UWO23034.1 carbohydrate ABC transporter permease [Marvinbryantia formatexigens DSM 14469]SDF96645.1 multiple sugar transport system permease protein [Marvinbryantia formatexigens]
MKKKKGFLRKWKRMEPLDKFVNVLVILYAIINLFPFYYLITSSFKTSAAIFKMPPDWWPKTFRYQNYLDLFRGQPAFRWAANSFLVAFLTTMLVVICSSMAAYGISKVRFKGKNIIFAIFIGALMIPKEIFIVPLFQIITNLNLSDTYAGMILPNVASTFGVFLLKGFFDTVPDSIRESGKLDGASEFRIFSELIIPIVKPGIGALFILNFVNIWNDYLWQLLIARSKNMMTLMVGTASIMQEISPNYGYKMAGAAVASVPMLLIFLFFQRYFTSGITMGAVKE